jgi:hypothetical protein
MADNLIYIIHIVTNICFVKLYIVCFLLQNITYLSNITIKTIFKFISISESP